MAKPQPPLQGVDISDLTAADWVEIDKLKAAYDNGGREALSKAFDELDPVRCTNIMAALYPDMVSEVIREETAKPSPKPH
jgi:hypothetical protein